MKELVVLSGKGGTGKTTVSASLASLWRGRVLCVDADVDAANLHLVLPPRDESEKPFVGGTVARVDRQRCNQCGLCSELCRFHAIAAGMLRPIACEGCGLCALGCPAGAVAMVERISGAWSVGQSDCATLLQARLFPGEGNSGKLVSLLKEEARKIAAQQQPDWLLCDGPPGTGCPTMASLAGSDALLAVAEPSASGLHDLSRLLDLAAHFGIAAYACINKADLSASLTRQVTAECRHRQVPVLAEIPYDPAVSDCVRQSEAVVQRKDTPAAGALRVLANNLEAVLADRQAPVEPRFTDFNLQTLKGD